MSSTNEKRTSSYNKFSFKMAIFGQTIKEQVQNSFGILKPKPTIVDKQVEATIKKVNDLKSFIEISHSSIKNIINGMTKAMEAEQTFATLLKEESCREEKDVCLRTNYINVGDSFMTDYKDINTKLLIPLKNYESWLNIFLTKAIPDMENTINQCKQARTEMNTYSNILGETSERIRFESEGSLEYISDKKIISESKIHLEESKKRFELLKVQLSEKADMLEIKRQADLPSHLDSVHNALRIYHGSAALTFSFKEKTKSSVDNFSENKSFISESSSYREPSQGVSSRASSQQDTSSQQGSVPQESTPQKPVTEKPITEEPIAEEQAQQVPSQLPTQSFGPR